MMGIGKRALLEDYYFDEFLMVLKAHNEMTSIKTDDSSNEVQEVTAEVW